MKQTLRSVPSAAETVRTLRIGGLARLKSGSPEMTIVALLQVVTKTRRRWFQRRASVPPNLIEDQARCVWIDEYGNYNTADIPLVALKPN